MMSDAPMMCKTVWEVTYVWMFHTPSRKHPVPKDAPSASPHSDVEVKMYLLRMYSAEVPRLLLAHLLSAVWMLTG